MMPCSRVIIPEKSAGYALADAVSLSQLQDYIAGFVSVPSGLQSPLLQRCSLGSKLMACAVVWCYYVEAQVDFVSL